MRNVPKQIHILVVLLMLVLAAYRIGGIILVNRSPFINELVLVGAQTIEVFAEVIYAE
jgi:hypothetical protein